MLIDKLFLNVVHKVAAAASRLTYYTILPAIGGSAQMKIGVSVQCIRHRVV